MTTFPQLRPDEIDTLLAYARDRRRDSRLPRPEASHPGDPALDTTTARWRRLAVTHAVTRLPAGSHATAAAPGLQDSAPRSGQLSLHARVSSVDPAAWEHPALQQIWFRGADYIIPKADRALFTRGVMPRDPERASALERLADCVVQHLDAGVPANEIEGRLDGLPLRATSATGRVAIRWDARTVELIVAGAPDVDDEEARLRLAERFVHFYGPVTSPQLAKWAGVSRSDAEETWRQLDNLTAVATPRGRAWMFDRDLDHATGMSRPAGVRLLPQGDPALYVDPPGVPATPSLTGDDEKVTRRVVNGLTGRVVVDGEVVGAWGRRGGTVSLFPWTVLDERAGDVEDEAESVACAVGKKPRVDWLGNGASP